MALSQTALPRCWRATTGRATCASCRISWSAPRCSAALREVDARFFAPLLPRAAEEETAETEDLRLEPAVEQLERQVILRALGASGDNKPQAARLLGVSERTLWYKLKKYNL